MDFYTYTTLRDWARRTTPNDRICNDIDAFFGMVSVDAHRQKSGQLLGQGANERDWEKGRRPYYNVWPAIVPMLTRLNLDLDSSLIRLPLPALCIRFPKDEAKNPLKFDWKGKTVPIRCILMGYINDETGISLLIDIGETMPLGVPIYSYRNFPRKEGLTVEQSLAGLQPDPFAEIGVQMPNELALDCVRLCCSLCLLENDSEIISPERLWLMIEANTIKTTIRSSWTRPIVAAKSAGTWGGISKSFPITAART